MTLGQQKELLEKIHYDPKQFGVVFDHWYKPVFGYVFRRTGDYNLTCDIVAETFLHAFLKIQSFQWKGVSLSAWLFKIATNEVNQYYRRKRYRPETLQSFLDYEKLPALIVAEKDQLEEELRQHGEFQHVQEKLGSLDVKYQEVIALRYFEKKDILEIVEILGKPEGTVKSLISRGLSKLREVME